MFTLHWVLHVGQLALEERQGIEEHEHVTLLGIHGTHKKASSVSKPGSGWTQDQGFAHVWLVFLKWMFVIEK